MSVQLKQLAGEFAAGFVQSGMAIGLGTGSTAIWATRKIAEMIREGTVKGVVAMATSIDTEADARTLGIPLFEDRLPELLDLTIDGADEVDPNLNVIKGGGGAMLREKIVAKATRREIIVVDESKLSPCLGTIHSLPVEVLPYAVQWQSDFLESIGGNPHRRTLLDGNPFLTDQGNFIFDCKFGPIIDIAGLAAQLDSRPGIVAHGLFIGLVSDLVVAGPDGVRHEVKVT